MRYIFLFLAWMIQWTMLAQDSLTIVSYNIENLFDCQHDTLKNDSSFLPEGMHHWTPYRYHTKLDRIAQVLVNIAGWERVGIVGLCEVENDACLRDLCYKLNRFHYKYVHYESHDERGIDVALLYDSTQVEVLDSKPLYVRLDGDLTRDILYVQTKVNQCDTLHIMLCHLPSMLGGSSATDWKRKIAKQVIQHQIDSIVSASANANIIVMGDMNSSSQNDIEGMNNMMIDFERKGKGTHKYRGVWSCLDQFYLSSELAESAHVEIFMPDWLLEEDMKYLGFQPRRTYIGYRYHAGYSDHLPIILRLKI